MKISIIALLLALAAWAFPIHAASALKQTNEAEAIFINYEQFHKINASPSSTNSVAGQPNKERKRPSILVSKTLGGTDSRRSNEDYRGKTFSKEEVIQLIKDYSAQYGISPEVPLCIAKAESGFNHLAKNKSSSASGVFQYLNSTWKGTDEGKAGLSVFDAEANVKATIKYMASRKSTRPWEVRNKCPNLQ